MIVYFVHFNKLLLICIALLTTVLYIACCVGLLFGLVGIVVLLYAGDDIRVIVFLIKF